MEGACVPSLNAVRTIDAGGIDRNVAFTSGSVPQHLLRNPALNTDIPNFSVRKNGMLEIFEVLQGRWEMLV
jgi:hypothetical protein